MEHDKITISIKRINKLLVIFVNSIRGGHLNRNFVDRVLQKKWPLSKIEKYVGNVTDAWLTYSTDEEIQQKAASGGTITGLLLHLLETGEIDGTLVCASYVECKEVKTRYLIAKNRADLLKSQDSKYIDTDFAHEAIPLIKQFKGKLALVLLPCDLALITRLTQNDEDLNTKIVFKISLFCGHVSSPELTKLIVRKIKPAGTSLIDFRYRSGHWRGNIVATFENGKTIEKPSSYFKDYQNLYFFCARKCLHCADQTGYTSDISVGDVWLFSMKDNPIKHNALLIRTPAGKDLISNALESESIAGKQVPIDVVCDAQSHSLLIHHNVTARKLAGKLFKMNIADPVNDKVRLIDFLVALVVISNYRLSNSNQGWKIISKLPKQVVKGYLYFLRALELLQ